MLTNKTFELISIHLIDNIPTIKFSIIEDAGGDQEERPYTKHGNHIPAPELIKAVSAYRIALTRPAGVQFATDAFSDEMKKQLDKPTKAQLLAIEKTVKNTTRKFSAKLVVTSVEKKKDHWQVNGKQSWRKTIGLHDTITEDDTDFLGKSPHTLWETLTQLAQNYVEGQGAQQKLDFPKSEAKAESKEEKPKKKATPPRKKATMRVASGGVQAQA